MWNTDHVTVTQLPDTCRPYAIQQPYKKIKVWTQIAVYVITTPTDETDG